MLELQYSDENYKDLEEQISTKEYWREFPMEEELTKHLMGLDFELPENGYYLFYDRHKEADSHYDVEEMPKRSSMDFSVIISDWDGKKWFILKRTRKE